MKKSPFARADGPVVSNNSKANYRWFGALCCLWLLAACSSTLKPKDDSYRLENFAPDSPFEQSFELSPTAACEAGRRALLSQGYLIDESKVDSVRARKYFQPEKERHVELQLQVTCVAEGADED